MALSHLSQKDYDTALEMAEKSIILAPSHSEILGIGAMIQNKMGNPDRGLTLIKKTMRCCPNYPSWFLQVLGTSYRLTGQLDAAIATFQAAIQRTQDFVSLHVNLASALGEAGLTREAKQTVSEILRINPGFSVKEYMHSISYRDPAEMKRLEDSLRAVGLPG